MLKKNMVILLMFCLLIAVSCIKQNTKDNEDIKQTLLDYAEGWFSGDAVRMERVMHPNFILRNIENPDSENSVLYDTKKGTVINMAESGGGKFAPKDSYKIEIKIFDVQNNIASAVIKSVYIDYMLLGKFNKKWVILNVLWDNNRNK